MCSPSFVLIDAGQRVLGLPARDFFRVLNVGEIDHAHRARCVVGQINIVTVNERAVNAAA